MGCFSACKRFWTCESQNPDNQDPPMPINPLPPSKLAKQDPKNPPHQSTFDRPVVPADDAEGNPSKKDLMQYRHHYGVNLGGYFVLERWLHKSMFIQGPKAKAELDAVSVYFEKHGEAKTRAKWEEHWASALSDDEIGYLVKAGCTSVRLPIGHWIVGKGYCVNTPFGNKIAKVYVNGWQAVRELCARLYDRGIGVVIDLHALPFGANKGNHSGTSTHRADFWTSKQNRDIATRCLQYITHEIHRGNLVGIIGLQICNAVDKDAEGVHKWYHDVVVALSQIDATIPIYVSDAANFEAALEFAAPLSLHDARRNPIVIDTQRFYCFPDDDDQVDQVEGPPQISLPVMADADDALQADPEPATEESRVNSEIIPRVAADANALRKAHKEATEQGCVDFIIGEYSCCIDSKASMRPEPTPEHEEAVLELGQAQSSHWQAIAGGSYFWTAKMEWMPGSEWGFTCMTDRGAIQAPAYMHWQFGIIRTKNAIALAEMKGLRAESLLEHISHCENAAGTKTSVEDMNSYEDGWTKGFLDASEFFMGRIEGNAQGTAEFGADRIGFLSLWMERRALEHKIGDKDIVRWKNGFKDGVHTFEERVGITDGEPVYTSDT